MPTQTASSPIEIVIPGSILAGGQDITVTANPGAKWRITGTDGSVVVDVQPHPDVPAVSLPNQQALIAAALTQAEKDEMASNPDVGYDLTLKVEPAGADDVAKQKAQDKGYKVADYYDITLEKVKLINGVPQGVDMVTTLSDSVHIEIEIPEELRAKRRSFAMVRNHNGTAELLSDLDDDANTLTIETDRFSPYALVYKNVKPNAPAPAQPGASAPPATATSPQTGDDSNAGLWIVLLVAAALGLAVTGRACVLHKAKEDMAQL